MEAGDDNGFAMAEACADAMDEAGHRGLIIDMAWGQMKDQPFATVTDHDVQLEAVEPAHRGFPTGSLIGEDPMLVDTRIFTHG